MRILFFLLLSFFSISFSALAQSPTKLSSNQLFEKLKKINFLGSVLYVAAHPDDENTRLISYLSNQINARTAYLSLTRGDGGQNLIGPEIRELLGVIRTQELLAARKIDGGEQLFSRANDFGYSKHPDETLDFWDKNKILADIVWAIRTFKPDVIINRFDHRTPGTTHGHHTASAMLSVEAFDLSNRVDMFQEQLKYTKVWKPKKMFFNTSWWFYGSQDAFEKQSKNKLTSFDVGVYYPLKGLSNNEVAAIASSQHLCQGFGRLTVRGSEKEYIEFLKGEVSHDKNDIFSGINTKWNRIEGGKQIGTILYEIESQFNFTNPSIHLPKLLEAYKLIQNLKDEHWRAIKTIQIKELIEAVAGLYLEASSEMSSATPNSKITLNIETLNRSNSDIYLVSINSLIDRKELAKSILLKPNEKQTIQQTIQLNIPEYVPHYWLKKPWSLGMYQVASQKNIGMPMASSPIKVEFKLQILGEEISFVKDVVYRYAERDKGEIYEPFYVLPKVTTKLHDKVYIFSENKPQDVIVEVKSGEDAISGNVMLQIPKNWKVSPSKIPFEITQKGDVKKVIFSVTPSKQESVGVLNSIALIDGEKFEKELIEIDYQHIPKQAVLLNSQAKVVRLNIQKKGNYIGYIKGAGDAVPQSLKQIGYQVEMINLDLISTEYLKQFDAIVVGIRAYNTVADLKFKQKYLLEYVENGGNVIVQYNTSGRGKGLDVKAPYQLNLSRDRVTDEKAPVSFLDTNHEVLNYPNKISKNDFDGWAQERGLYFPSTWANEFTPILAMNDKGENSKKGSLLVAKFGKGYYIYTGLSFFRELPAGVPGAYRLFANLLSIGKKSSFEDKKMKY